MSLRVAVALLTLAGLALYTAGLLVEKSTPPPVRNATPNPISEEVGR